MSWYDRLRLATPASLLKLIEDGVIDRVLLPMKSGKEADLYVVEKDGVAYAAKVYKRREVRSFKNNAAYRDGRSVRNTRSARAMDKGTKFGKKTAEDAWQKAEVEALRRLHAAGVRVPQVYAHYEGVLVMELVVDEQGRPAPQLAQLQHLAAPAAETLYEQLVGAVIQMLLADLVHGDFSPYNVLVGAQGPVVIDLPQVVSASHNLKACVLVERDIQSVARYLGIFSPQVRRLAREAWQVWREYERGTLVPEFRPTVPVEAPPDPNAPKPAPVDTGEVLGLVREAQRERDRPHGGGGRRHDRGGRADGQRPPRHEDRGAGAPLGRADGPRPPRHDDRGAGAPLGRADAPRPQHAQPHPGGPRPQHAHQGDRGPRHHEGDRGPRHGDRGRQHDRGPRPHDDRGAGAPRGRADGPRPHGDRGPRPHGDRGPRHHEGDRGPRPQHAQQHGAHGGNGQPGGNGGGGRRRRRRRRGPRPDGPPAGA